MNLHFHSELFGVTGFKILSHPVDIPALFANDHPLDYLAVNYHSELNEVWAIWFFGYGFTFEDGLVGQATVSTMEEGLFEHLFNEFMFGAICEGLFRVLPLTFSSHS